MLILHSEGNKGLLTHIIVKKHVKFDDSTLEEVKIRIGDECRATVCAAERVFITEDSWVVEKQAGA